MCITQSSKVIIERQMTLVTSANLVYRAQSSISLYFDTCQRNAEACQLFFIVADISSLMFDVISVSYVTEFFFDLYRKVWQVTHYMKRH